MDISGGPFDLMSRRLIVASSRVIAERIAKEITEFDVGRDDADDQSTSIIFPSSPQPTEQLLKRVAVLYLTSFALRTKTMNLPLKNSRVGLLNIQHLIFWSSFCFIVLLLHFDIHSFSLSILRPSIHPSILFCLSGVRSRWQQVFYIYSNVMLYSVI